MSIRTIHVTPGEVTVVRNPSKGATAFRAEFPGAGWVEVVVPPGGEFRFCAEIPEVNVYIVDFRPAGLGPADQ